MTRDNAAYLREVRAKAVENGFCLECRNREAKADCVTCEVCLARRRLRSHQRSVQKLCVCGQPREQGKWSCRRCIDAKNAYQTERRNDAITLGMCTYCWAEKARSGRRTCLPCGKKAARKQRKTYKALKASGVCAFCARPKISETLCQWHLDKSRAYNVDRK